MANCECSEHIYLVYFSYRQGPPGAQGSTGLPGPIGAPGAVVSVPAASLRGRNCFHVFSGNSYKESHSAYQIVFALTAAFIFPLQGPQGAPGLSGQVVSM